MSLKVASLYAEIGANVTNFEQGTKKVTSGLRSMASAFSGVLPAGAAQFLTLTGAIAGTATALKYSVDQAAEAQAIQARLNAVLASTNGIAGLTADELDRMATGLSHISIYDDEAIKGSEALLLTFTRIGRDVFPQATQAILDMRTALGTDLESSTMQLGKALNDPIAGLTALTRVGVSFTEAQKEMIKTLVESGDIVGAQRVILNELTTEFGGQAAAAAGTYSGAIAQLKNEFSNLAEAIGTEMIPQITELAVQIKDMTIWVTENWNAIKKWGEVLMWVSAPGVQLAGVMSDLRRKYDESRVANDASTQSMSIAQKAAEALTRSLQNIPTQKTITIKTIIDDIVGFFGGGRAAGGPVMRGTPYMVGERGPEMFVPQTAGRIVPATQLKEKQAQQTVNITINGNFRNINDLDYLAQEITKRSIPA